MARTSSKKQHNSSKSIYKKPQAKVLNNIEIVDGKNPDDLFSGVDFDKIAEDFEKKHRPKPPILQTVPARILGACVILFIIGAIIGSVFGVRAILEVKKEQDLKIQAIADYVSPVVAIGVQPFDNANEIEIMNKLRCCALYAIENNHNELVQNSLGKTLLPTYMMKSAAENLFGEDISMTYYSFDISGSLFEYDSEDKCYMFSASGVSTTYTPQIVSYSKKDSVVTARIKYVASNGEVNAYNDMEYIYKIRTEKGENVILKIQKVK